MNKEKVKKVLDATGVVVSNIGFVFLGVVFGIIGTIIWYSNYVGDQEPVALSVWNIHSSYYDSDNNYTYCPYCGKYLKDEVEKYYENN